MKNRTTCVTLATIALALIAMLAYTFPTATLEQPIHAAWATPEAVTHLSNFSIEDWSLIEPQPAISVTQDMTITGTGTFTLLESAADVSTGAVAAGGPGQLLIFLVTTPHTITISDTGNIHSSGDTVLSEDDTATFISDGTAWMEIGQATN